MITPLLRRVPLATVRDIATASNTKGNGGPILAPRFVFGLRKGSSSAAHEM